MASMIGSWLADSREVYLGNATAVRDFRVQLRGNRSVMLFGIYLVLLIGVAMYTYSNAVNQYGSTIVEAQFSLHNFYQVTMMLLAGTVVLVAPGLTATTIVMERQRQSIDLVFSAPVSPKYYLVGKMISSFRYTWMLLVLALPVTAASVVLGGASWTEVLEAYVLISLHGLMLTAIALLISTFSAKPVAAIIWSYLAAIVVNAMAGSAATASLFRFMGRASDEAPFWVAFSPFSVVQSARTYTLIGGHQIPNWILALVVTLLVVKICLLGAGSILNQSGGMEVVGLRLHGLIYALAVFGLAGWLTASQFTAAPTGLPFGSDPRTLSARFIAWVTMPLIVFLPFIACYGFDRERRYKPNGLFGLKQMLDGTPSGGLPYLLALLAAIFGGFAVAAWGSVHIGMGSAFWSYTLYISSFWVAFWALGRLISAFSKSLKNSRTMLFAMFLLFVVLPYPILVVISGVDNVGDKSGLWNLYVLTPLSTSDDASPGKALWWAGILIALTLGMIAVSEPRIRQKLSTMRNYDEQPA